MFLPCICTSVGVGHQQSYWLCHQRVLQHECVGDDLGQSCVSGVQLLSTVRLPTALCSMWHSSKHTNNNNTGSPNWPRPVEGTVSSIAAMWELLPVYVHQASSCFLKMTNKMYETHPCFSRGNWWGHAPYKYGAPCSACPASYAGGCRDNLCYKGTNTVGCCYPLIYAVKMCLVCLNNTWNKGNLYIYICIPADDGVDRHTAAETEDTNYIEPESARDRDPGPRAQNPNTTPSDNPERHQFVSTEQMSMDQTIGPHLNVSTDVTVSVVSGQQVHCDTKLRDQCKGTTCNRWRSRQGTHTCLYEESRGHLDFLLFL